MLVSAHVRRRVHLGALLVVGLAGCQEPPSFRTRWSVIDREGTKLPATAALHCTSLGINTVRVRVFDEAGFFVDDSYHPCFAGGFEDPDATVAGPTLDAGTYAIEVRGVQRDLEPWPVALQESAPGDCEDDIDNDADGPTDKDDEDCRLATCGIGDTKCDPRDIACDCADVDVRDDHTVRLRGFVLDAPDECVDGIDNDRDGLLDANDPSCGLDTLPRQEGRPVSKVQFRVGLSLFDGTDVVSCGAVGLTTVQARLCARGAGEPAAACTDADAIATLACREGEPTYFEQTLLEGDYSLELVGLAAGGVARTIGELFPISVSEGAGALVPIEVDFSAADFEPPIEQSAGFTLEFDFASGPRACKTPDKEDVIADVVFEVRDAHGTVLDFPVSFSDVEGKPLAACPADKIITEPLTWGGYSLRVEARNADGTVCFTTDGAGPGGADAPFLLSPGDLSFVVPAVLGPGGSPPPGCG